MERKLSLPAVPERLRKQTVAKAISHDENKAIKRGSMDFSISPVVSLKKKVPRQRRVSLFFGAMHMLNKKFSSLGNELNNIEIVSPFAQILTKLNSVKKHLEAEPKTPVNTDMLRRNTHAAGEMCTLSPNMSIDDHIQRLKEKGSNGVDKNDANYESNKALADIIWCLEQLKKIQTNSSLSEMTKLEFRKVLTEKRMSSDPDLSSQIFQFLNQTYDQSSTVDSDARSISSGSRPSCDSSSASSEKKVSNNSWQADEPTILVTDEHDGSEETEHDRLDITKLQSLSILTPNTMTEELDNLLQARNNWGIDVFRLSELTNERPLTVLAYTIFQSRDILGLFRIDENTFVKFFTCLEGRYRSDVPYHNYRHGADVMQSTHVLLNSKTLKNVFSPLEVLSALFAAAIHDVDHPGVTNQYLVNTGSELALMYNDVSVLENHHLSTAFKLLRQDGCNIFENLSKDDFQKLRKLVIDIVLATDMSKHMTLLADMKTMIETQIVNTSCGHLYLDNYTSKSLVLQNMIHCADLSNPTKPLSIYNRWTNLILEEFFQQGDNERDQGLNISFNCDRNKVCIDESQLGFIDFIVRPLWETWADLVHPDVQQMLDILEENRKWHSSKALPRYSKVSTESMFSDVQEENET